MDTLFFQASILQLIFTSSGVNHEMHENFLLFQSYWDLFDVIGIMAIFHAQTLH